MKSTFRALLLFLLGTAIGIGLPRGERWLRHFNLLPARGGALRSIAIKVEQPLQSAVSSCTMVVVDDYHGILNVVATRGNALKGNSSLLLVDFPVPGHVQPLGTIPLATKLCEQSTSLAFLVDLPGGGLSRPMAAATLSGGP